MGVEWSGTLPWQNHHDMQCVPYCCFVLCWTNGSAWYLIAVHYTISWDIICLRVRKHTIFCLVRGKRNTTGCQIKQYIVLLIVYHTYKKPRHRLYICRFDYQYMNQCSGFHSSTVKILICDRELCLIYHQQTWCWFCDRQIVMFISF